uniref:alpha-L-fucosidase n=1 Tax=Candidatus Fimivicinus sp. TaxID=3056640 RepID=UPI003FF0B71B
MTNEELIKRAAAVVPSERQLRWQEMEFYAFAHFGMNTFSGQDGREWGVGSEDPRLFNPTDFDADQWVAAVQSAGMTGLLLTAKHHDGFCLWPSAYTEHCVKNSPWRGGKGDVVREVSDACRRGGIKFGIYLSPWDRHESTYGSGEAYDDYYCNQLRELLTNYGELFCVWFDGACGEGPNGKKQEYDWARYHALIRELQPEAVISICGPDVRWCGNEAGKCRASEWSVVPSTLLDVERIAENSQHEDDGKFSRKYEATDEDLGSRAAIASAKKLVWFPAEVDTSIRPGWFYHKKEDRKVRPLKKLMKIYYSSVGANATLLLNIPPDQRGRFADRDVKRLQEIGNELRSAFRENLAVDAKAMASSEANVAHAAHKALSADKNEYWRAADGVEQAEIIVDLGKPVTFSKVVLGEYLPCGQHIEHFTVFYEKKGRWKKVYTATVVGHKRICLLKKTAAQRIKITIDECRTFPTLRKLEVY